ncbi:MAG: hypothetical protein N2049_08795 [Anaerolineales bacterium]|nr:hypothetical protein [Anaerolineales bacterium]MDW8227708.1 hypothetical protein [Anaerolineales bacterium]
MAYLVVVHISNEEPILAELDELPSPTATLVILRNPRRRDGKDIHYLQSDVTSVIWPINQISFMEILPSEGEEKIIGFVRE